MSTPTIAEQKAELYRQLEVLKLTEREERRAIREAIWKKEKEEEEAFKNVLAHDFNLARDACFEKAYDFAYERGHSSGQDEVRMYFDELVDLIRLARKTAPEARP